MKKPRSSVGMSICLLTSVLLIACSDHEHPKNGTLTVYHVAMTTLHNTLHFTGTVQPLKESTMTSPVEAVVESMDYHYGQHVKPGQVIFTLNSAELQKQYNDTLTDYLKTKDSYTIARAKFIGTEELWTAGLLSKNNYLSEKSSLNTSRVSLMQATRKLAEMREKMGDGHDENLSGLSFAAFDKVRLALNRQHNRIYLKSPSDGVLLYPPKSGDDRAARINVGSPIKAGQVLALIGDLSGIRVEIDIPEVDISEIKVGLPATIRGIAFGKQELRGKLVAINAQASVANGGALPTFTAVVEVHALNPVQQSWVKVGMSASIELAIVSGDKLMVPIAAVKQTQGNSTVQVRASDGSITARSIITGPVFDDKVVVDVGLNVGDDVVYQGVQ